MEIDVKNDNSHEAMLNHDISKLFIMFVVPSVICMLISGLQSVIDGIFVSNFIGANAMTSINMAVPFMQLILGVGFIVGIGSQSFIGLSLGAKDIKKSKDTFKTILIVTTLIGIIVTIIGVMFSDTIAVMLGASDVLKDYVSLYIRTISLFTIPMDLMLLFGFCNRIIGKPDLYFKASLLSLITNVILNYFLVAKLNYGIIGAASATGISFSMGFLVVLWPMFNKKNIINIFHGKFDKNCIAPVFYNGSSEGVISVSTAVTIFIFNMVFMHFAKEDGVAAFTAINYVMHFGLLLLFGISDGIGPIVSYNYGAEKFHRVKSTLKISKIIGFTVGVILCIILFFFGENLVSIFINDNEEIIKIASTGGKIISFSFLLSGINIINSSYFTAIGKAKESIVVAAGRGLVFIMIGILILPLLFELNGVWMSILFAEICTMVIGSFMIRRNYKSNY